jgi:hypothetical protein
LHPGLVGVFIIYPSRIFLINYHQLHNFSFSNFE